MADDSALGEAARDYAEAYEPHNCRRDLSGALHLYQKLMASHASTAEAVYSLSQIQNIVQSVVPAQALLDAQTALAFGCLEETTSGDVAPTLITSSSTESA